MAFARRSSSVARRVYSQRVGRGLRALGRVLGSIQLQKLMGITWPWEAPVNSRLGPQV
jgi:superfamily II DNA or RNA helicase